MAYTYYIHLQYSCTMAFKPLQKPEAMSPERLSNCRACYEVQDLYWERERTQDPERLAEIDRQLVDYLLKLDEPIEYKGETIRILDDLGLNDIELGTLRHRKKISDEVRAKLRIFCQDFIRGTVGT